MTANPDRLEHSIAQAGQAQPWWLGLRERFSWRHSDQLIAYSRLVLAAVALLAVYVDPTQPARYADLTYLILALYALYALVLATFAGATAAVRPGALLRHAIDIGVFAALMYLTAGPTSPFFVFFTFAIVTGALRWGAGGAIGTAAVLLVIFLGIGLRDLGTPDEPDLNRVIMRSAYLLVASVLLGYFGAYRQRSRDRLARLAAWPQPEQDAGDRPALDASLRHAALVLEVRGILVLWEESAGAWRIAHWTGRSCEYSRWTAPRGKALIAPDLADEAFMMRAAAAGEVITARSREAVASAPLLPEFARSLVTGAFSTAPFRTDHSRGRVFILEPRPLTADLLSLTGIVAGRIGFEFEHFWLRSDVAATAAARERARLARDMHDSILQGLTAVGLQLKVMSDRAQPEARAAYSEVMKLVAAQQRRLREFVSAMNPKPGQQVALAEIMERTAAELARQWRCRVVWEVLPEDAALDTARALQLQLLLAEAVANAVRHGEARELDITIDLRDALKIEIRDDGTGRTGGVGEGADSPTPFALTQRVEELGGTCRLAIAEAGASLSIELPTE